VPSKRGWTILDGCLERIAFLLFLVLYWWRVILRLSFYSFSMLFFKFKTEMLCWVEVFKGGGTIWCLLPNVVEGGF
jgi:hypothetical protein